MKPSYGGNQRPLHLPLGDNPNPHGVQMHKHFFKTYFQGTFLQFEDHLLLNNFCILICSWLTACQFALQAVNSGNMFLLFLNSICKFRKFLLMLSFNSKNFAKNSSDFCACPNKYIFSSFSFSHSNFDKFTYSWGTLLFFFVFNSL